MRPPFTPETRVPTPASPAARLTYKDLELKVSLGYTVHRAAWATQWIRQPGLSDQNLSPKPKVNREGSRSAAAGCL